MIDPVVEERLHAALNALPLKEQQRVADYANSLSGRTRKALPPGTPVKDLMPLFGSVDAEYAQELREAIEDCEQVDLSEW